MKRVLIAILLAVAGSASVSADDMTRVVSNTTLARTTRTVFNNAGSAITSYSVVNWDNDGANGSSTAFDRSGYPYITTTTTADSVWVAGVTTDASCADQTLCEIVTEGPAITRIAGSTDDVSEDQLVATSTVAGQAGDYGPAANTCAVGTSMEKRQALTGATTSINVNNTPEWVYVHISCQ